MSGILARLREYFDDQQIVSVGRRMALTPLGECLRGKVNDVLVMIDATLGTHPDLDPSKSRRHFGLVASDASIGVLIPVAQARAGHPQIRQPAFPAGGSRMRRASGEASETRV
jgi:DNA-binding transcriptional LysR family regulator